MGGRRRKKTVLHPRLEAFREAASEALRKTSSFLKRRQQIMLVPHTGKKLHTFRISNLTILLSIVTVCLIIVFSIISLNQHEANVTRITALSSRTTSDREYIRIFRIYSSILSRSFEPLFRESSRLSGTIGGIDISRSGLSLVSFSNNNYTNAVREEMEQYARVGNRLLATMLQASNTANYVQGYRETIRHTPSIWPIGGEGFITSPFGMRRSPFTGLWQHHTGVDIAYWPGTPILATADGIVEGASWMGGYGMCIIIRHQFGFRTRYAHLSAIRVTVEQHVSQGQVIGTMGSTGLSTGYHLHYEVTLGNDILDPGPFLVNRTQL